MSWYITSDVVWWYIPPPTDLVDTHIITCSGDYNVGGVGVCSGERGCGHGDDHGGTLLWLST